MVRDCNDKILLSIFSQVFYVFPSNARGSFIWSNQRHSALPKLLIRHLLNFPFSPGPPGNDLKHFEITSDRDRLNSSQAPAIECPALLIFFYGGYSSVVGSRTVGQTGQ